METIDPKLVAQLAKLIEMTYNVLYAVIAMTAAVTWFAAAHHFGLKSVKATAVRAHKRIDKNDLDIETVKGRLYELKR